MEGILVYKGSGRTSLRREHLDRRIKKETKSHKYPKKAGCRPRKQGTEAPLKEEGCLEYKAKDAAKNGGK